MAAYTYELVIEQGATLRRKLVWKDKAKVAIDLTGARVEFQVRPSSEDGKLQDPVIDFDSTALTTGQTLGPLDVTGVIEFAISDTITRALSFGTGQWDMFVTLAGADRDKLVKGPSSLDLAVTQ